MNILRFLKIVAAALFGVIITIIMLDNLESTIQEDPQKNCDIDKETSMQVKKDCPDVHHKSNLTVLSEKKALAKEMELLLSVPDFMKYTLGTTQAEFITIIFKFCVPKMLCEFQAVDPGQLAQQYKSLGGFGNNFLIKIDSYLYEYHFASTMGYLIQNADGIGCYNLYPNCPLSQKQLLQFADYILSEH